jgi:hypothetical protein
VGAPRVPTPVLLGPVDRVGGHRADEGAKAVGQFEASVDQTASYGRDETRGGTTVYVREERSFSRDGTGKLSVQLLRASEGRGDRDARKAARPAGGEGLGLPSEACRGAGARPRPGAVRAGRGAAGAAAGRRAAFSPRRSRGACPGRRDR